MSSDLTKYKMANEYTQAEAEAARTKLAAYDAKVAEATRIAREAHLEPIKSLVSGDAYDFILAQLEAIGDHYDIELNDDNRYGVDANLMSTIAALRQVMVSAKTVAESAY